ncbi:MAG: ClpXP protease specificity-enhancing factor SspB [Pseudomonadota bacterium]
MTNDEQPEDLIRYDVLTQDALRDVIRKVLEEVSIAGLPGEHHFFITFRTDHPGVRLSARMRERYPEEMTIVIQHSFWDLKVNDSGFEIDLSFDDILERLKVPFSSLKGFFDPHVKFGVQFDAEYLEAANAEHSSVGDEDDDAKSGNLPQVAQSREMTKADKLASKPKKPAEPADDRKKKDPNGGADVVSLDQFRKKQ